MLQETIAGRICRSNNLFMVGDVKQSIYKFRLAEPEIFKAKYALYASPEEKESIKIDLNSNFRSKQQVTGLVNKVFHKIMDGYDENAELKCTMPDEFPTEADSLVAYVDGSYEHSLLKYAFGCVFLLPDRRPLTEKGSGNNPDSAKLRNVTGEMLGAMFAVKWALKNGFRKIEIRYDYEGVEKWVTGAWKSKTELTQKYAEAMRNWSRKITISFTKVAAHTNVYFNEMADELAKSALLEPEGIPEARLAEEMEAIK